MSRNKQGERRAIENMLDDCGSLEDFIEQHTDFSNVTSLLYELYYQGWFKVDSDRMVRNEANN